MATMTLSVQIGVAWCLPLYLHGLTLVCWTMGAEPDMDKVQRVISRGIRTRLVAG